MSKSAGILIVGDEILNGNVTDTNSSFLCSRLNSLGIRVYKVAVIPDQVDVISREVEQFSKLFDIVITTGGIGPTHDDVTYEGVASAFQVPLRKDERFERFYRSYLKDKDPAAEKLITIPTSADVVVANLEEPLGQGLHYFPVMRIRNVFCFPGIPSYTKVIFTALEKRYFQNISVTYFTRMIYLTVDEIYLVSILNQLVDSFKDCVTVGSYPLLGGECVGPAHTKITIESTSLDDCLTAEKNLISQLPLNWLTYPKLTSPNYDLIRKLTSSETRLSGILKTSFQIIEDCFSGYKENETFISFNGGKDCTVLLNLVTCFCLDKQMKQPLKLLYFKEADSFHEIDSFIEDIANNYNVDVVTLPTPIKDSLKTFLSTEPAMKVCFLGLRNADPRTESLKPMQETDSGWPKLIRVCPILHWSYKDVWDFIRSANIPYCSLYNQGYTSLGNKNNTVMNPALKSIGDDNSTYYKAAFLLDEDSHERNGRCFPTHVGKDAAS